MSAVRHPRKFLISIEEVLALHKGRYAGIIDDNLYDVIICIMRDKAELNIPKSFRDPDLERENYDGLGSHFTLWLKDNVLLDKEHDVWSELHKLIDDCESLYGGYAEFCGKICKVRKTPHEGNILVEIVSTVNDFLVARYEKEISVLIEREGLNPIHLAM